ncbi:hypothetical protein PFUGPA_03598 [Plasmodium falciparum Palo Alto/Uganda]|uniref:EF-hand domain-containing protein n=1 Tax=Plasmodium falciparum (isolate Palo Alto / Uganda) TaxID=57270 RepID=W4IV85_PLAFP|nr:hypothetical protein PFUGPA_03598 [Plasmodium falciparum Palo Alto/Uganda]
MIKVYSDHRCLSDDIHCHMLYEYKILVVHMINVIVLFVGHFFMDMTMDITIIRIIISIVVFEYQGLLNSKDREDESNGAHLAEKVEKGGEQIENTLMKLNVRYQTLFFSSGVMTVFCGSMSCLNLWPHSKHVSLFRSFWVILCSSFILTVAVVGFLIALRKSLRLEKLKKTIKLVSKGAYIDCYRKYSVADPDHGMQFEEFNRMCSDHTNGYIYFDFLDLFIIFNALDEHQKCSINEREFLEWINGPVTYL